MARPVTSPLHPISCKQPECGAPIWLKQVANAQGTPPRVMPLDAEPNPAGNIAAHPSQEWQPGRVVTPAAQLLDGWARFMPHFSTCTSPDAFRKRRRARPRAVVEPGADAQLSLIPATETAP